MRLASSSPQSPHETPSLGSFVVGPENRLVEVAVQSALSHADDGYSPIVFYGPCGTGKSHLALGLTAAWRALFRGQPAIYVTSADFARDLADAIQTKTADDFSAHYRQASLLVIDDLDHLAGKHAAQRELTFTLDALGSTGGRVVITASRLPTEIGGITAGLQSRLATGLAVPLARPGRESRLAIVRRLAELRGLKLSDPAAQMLADGLSLTVPGLHGVLVEIQLSNGMKQSVINGESVRQYLAHRNAAEQPSLREIAMSTARYFSLRVIDLRGTSRSRPVATARAVAMYLARITTAESLEKIGEYFGGRDHTTVSYSCRKTEERLEREPEIRHAVLVLQERLGRT